MKFVLSIIFISLFFLKNNKEQYTNRVSVFFMYQFTNDSIQVRVSKKIIHSILVNTNPTTGTAQQGFGIDRDRSDKFIIFSNLTKAVRDSVNVHNEYPFLYVYFNENKFEFRFEKKPLNIE